jgi:hypothetical protein
VRKLKKALARVVVFNRFQGKKRTTATRPLATIAALMISNYTGLVNNCESHTNGKQLCSGAAAEG